MKLLPQSPSWLPMSLHLAHALIAGGVGYMLGYSAVIYQHAEPGSTRALMAIVASFALAVFEIAFVVYILLRRRRMRRLWAEASALIELENWELAQLTLQELLRYPEYKLAPQPVLFALGACAEGAGQEREAMVLYRRCGEFPAALRAIGLLQVHRGLYDSAAEALRKLVARRPDDMFSVVLLALALFRGGNRDAAARALKRGLERRPKSEMLALNLARVENGEEPEFELSPLAPGRLFQNPE